ncbi:MAG: heme exporter protein CcmD [Oceanospirillaceae bacterium]
MQFETWLDVIEMGGHGLYVWSSFGLTVLVIALNVIVPLNAHKKIRVSLQKKFQRENNS